MYGDLMHLVLHYSVTDLVSLLLISGWGEVRRGEAGCSVAVAMAVAVVHSSGSTVMVAVAL